MKKIMNFIMRPLFSLKRIVSCWAEENRHIPIVWSIRRKLGLEPPYFDRFGGEENARAVLTFMINSFMNDQIEQSKEGGESN